MPPEFEWKLFAGRELPPPIPSQHRQPKDRNYSLTSHRSAVDASLLAVLEPHLPIPALNPLVPPKNQASEPFHLPPLQIPNPNSILPGIPTPNSAISSNTSSVISPLFTLQSLSDAALSPATTRLQSVDSFMADGTETQDAAGEKPPPTSAPAIFLEGEAGKDSVTVDLAGEVAKDSSKQQQKKKRKRSAAASPPIPGRDDTTLTPPILVGYEYEPSSNSSAPDVPSKRMCAEPPPEIHVVDHDQQEPRNLESLTVTKRNRGPGAKPARFSTISHELLPIVANSSRRARSQAPPPTYIPALHKAEELAIPACLLSATTINSLPELQKGVMATSVRTTKSITDLAVMILGTFPRGRLKVEKVWTELCRRTEDQLSREIWATIKKSGPFLYDPPGVEITGSTVMSYNAEALGEDEHPRRKEYHQRLQAEVTRLLSQYDTAGVHFGQDGNWLPTSAGTIQKNDDTL